MRPAETTIREHSELATAPCQGSKIAVSILGEMPGALLAISLARSTLIIDNKGGWCGISAR
jgi:hypothetical protein